MNSLRQKFVIFFLLLQSAPVLYSQVLVKISADKDLIIVGEKLTLTLEVRLPLGVKVQWVPLDTIPHFEWVEKGQEKITEGVDGKKAQKVFSVTSYDTGYWVIPGMMIKVGEKPYLTDTMGIRVEYSVGFNPEEDFRDIKQTEEVDLPFVTDYKWWIVGGATLLLLLLIIYFFRKRQLKQTVEHSIVLSPYEEAMQALALLRTEPIASPACIKQYYTRMNDILRNFISKQFKIATLEKTNDELVAQMKLLSVPSNQYQSLVEALRVTDFVKFAKYLPSVADNEKALSVIESAISSLHKSSP